MQMATKRKENPQKGGRKTAYLPLYAKQVKNLCLLNQGITDDEIASFFEKNVSCINNWKLKHPEFKESIREGKAAANTEIAAALYKRARGGLYLRQKEVKVKYEEYDSGTGKLLRKGEKVEVVDLVQDVEPDTVAGMYFLNNRAKFQWQARSSISGPDGGPVPVGMVALDDLLKTMTS